MRIHTNRFGISGEIMCMAERDEFAVEQFRESEMWAGRFFYGSFPFCGLYICIDNLLLSLLQQFLLDRIDQHTANLIDYTLNAFHREFAERNRGLVLYEKMYPVKKPIEFKKVERLGHRFLSVYVGPRPHDYEVHLDVEAQHA